MDSFLVFKLLCSYSWHVECYHTLIVHGTMCQNADDYGVQHTVALRWQCNRW